MRLENRGLYHMNPPIRFILLLVMTGISLLLGTLITFSIIASYLHVSFAQLQIVLMAPENARISLFANAFVSLIAFLLPSFTIAFFTKGSMAQNLGFRSIASYKLIYWVILLSFVGLILSGAAASFTEIIPIPAKFKELATDLENSYKQAIMAMTKMNSIGDLLINLFAVALIPAFVEELYFRGTMQKTFKNLSGNPVLAIIITAIIFSGFHFSYFGFLSRMMLGIVLGFIYEYTKSIWMPILLHFINNAFAIITIYSVRGDQLQMEKKLDETMPMYWGLFALAITIHLLYQIKKDAHYEGLDKNIRE